MVPVKKKTKIAILIASLAVFALVLAAALLLSRGAGRPTACRAGSTRCASVNI